MTNQTHQTSSVDRVFRTGVLRKLSSLRDGHLTIHDGEKTHRFGSPRSELRATVDVSNWRFFRRLALSGGLGAAESLLDGEWTCDDLTALVRIFIRNLNLSDQMNRGLGSVRRFTTRVGNALRRNTVIGSKRNIHQHYDLGNEFYSLWLDETMNYSCGVFENVDSTMRDASVAKMERVCRKLDLQPTDHLVEIGSGWGGLAVYAARNFGCRVTTTTISAEQYAFARERVRREGVADRVQVVEQDYRNLTGQYDKLVSIEMIEAVGHEYFETFFGKCLDLLKPNGMMVMQSIVMADERFRDHLKNVDFIRRYIFPGGCLPSISALTQAAANAAGMRLLSLEDIGSHYAETLRRWRTSFHAQLGEVRQLGFDERFVRMWDYYLCYCEAAFEERQVNNVQLLFAKRECNFDVVRSNRHASWETPVARSEPVMPAWADTGSLAASATETVG